MIKSPRGGFIQPEPVLSSRSRQPLQEGRGAVIKKDFDIVESMTGVAGLVRIRRDENVAVACIYNMVTSRA